MAAAGAGVLNDPSRRNSALIATPKMTLVSRNAATAGSGASVIAQVTTQNAKKLKSADAMAGPQPAAGRITASNPRREIAMGIMGSASSKKSKKAHPCTDSVYGRVSGNKTRRAEGEADGLTRCGHGFLAKKSECDEPGADRNLTDVTRFAERFSNQQLGYDCDDEWRGAARNRIDLRHVTGGIGAYEE